MKRVLHVLNNLGSGGAESFVMNVYRNIDRTKVQFDFLIRSTHNGPMTDEIRKLGGTVVILPPYPSKAVENYLELDRFLKHHAREYIAIHVHANALIYIKPLQLAKKYGIPCIIIHSHNTDSKFRLLHQINCNRINKWVTHRFACSNEAGRWMFPKRKYTVISNGIDIDKFSLNIPDREKVRSRFHLSDQVVIGNVGRFVKEKNHSFIIDVFDKYHRMIPNTSLLLVGDGEDKTVIENLVIKRGLEDSVIFTGAVTDVEKYLSAMDIFLLPSLHEGLPIALIEAQANGLPCLVSDSVSSAADCGLVKYQSLKAGVAQWSQDLIELHHNGIPRKGNTSEDNLKRYDIQRVAKKMEKFYLQCS